MALDFKKRDKAFYDTKPGPRILQIPAMTFLRASGSGDPNEEGGAYKQAVQSLYSLAYAIKMSKKGSAELPGYEDFVVPPLEGLWWVPGMHGFDREHKEALRWHSLLRMPAFVDQGVLEWAVDEVRRKKGAAPQGVELFRWEEGLVVQCLHQGPYDAEPATLQAMDAFAQAQGYVPDFSDARFHHEIYLSDPSRVELAAMKTLLRHPVRKG